MELIFNTQFKLHQTIYKKARALKVSEAGLSPQGWVWQSLEITSAVSLHSRMQDPQVLLVLRTLRDIAGDLTWSDCADVEPSQVTLEIGIQTLEALDNAVDQLPLGLDKKTRRASRLRLWLQRGLVTLGVPRAERVPVQYRSRFVSGRGQPRKMLSDEKSSPRANAEYPLGALPHSSVKDLIAKEREKRELDLLRVESAAISEIEGHIANFTAISDLLAAYPVQEKARIQMEMKSKRELLPAWMKELPPKEIAATYFQLFNDPAFWACREGPKLKAPGSSLVFEYLQQELKRPVPRYRLVETLVCTMAPQRILTACLLLIQAHTGWNVNSVLEMRRSMITGEYPRYSLQGYKSRVGQLTPIVEVSAANPGPLLAVKFLLDRHDWLASNCWSSPDESRLWLNPVSIQNDPDPKQYVGWGTSLRGFCERHGLQNFSFEQIRVQKLSLISLSAAGVHGAQDTAGHLQLSTTGHYLEQEVLIRLRSAMNLEFQRRLESAVEYDLEDVRGRKKHVYLLRDIGDGASCSAPNSPPRLEELVDGECQATTCHSGELGCPNRVIYVDPTSLESAVRTRRFYSSNWSRMAMDNAAAFQRIHLPRIVFNQALLHVIARSPYRSKLKAIERRVDGEFA